MLLIDRQGTLHRNRVCFDIRDCSFVPRFGFILSILDEYFMNLDSTNNFPIVLF